jgi:hypothetical protein
MGQPVWVLSVDLQTKTATFQSGMAAAARYARSAFTEIKTGAAEAGAETSFSMMEARHSVMILGEEFGVKIPRALAGFIASLGPLGPALEAAFPFMAIALGASMIVEHLSAMHEAGVKLTEDQIGFGTAVNLAFNSLDQKLVRAQMRSDELSNNHLAALHRQLQLIDMQSLAELAQQFDDVAKKADPIMKGLEGHWYTFGKGSDVANEKLQSVKTEYESLVAAGKQDEAHGLLAKTAEDAVKTRDALKTYLDNSGTLLSAPKDGADTGAALTAYQTLHAAKLSGTKSELEAHEELVSWANAELRVESEIAKTKDQDKGNANKAAANAASVRTSAEAKESAESMARMAEQSVAAEKSSADATLTIQHATLEQRLASDLDFATRERDVKQAANAAEIAALDKSGADYTNQLKAMHDKSLEITNEYNAKVIELQAKSSEAAAARDLTAYEEGERGKIELTEKGTAARVAAIDAAIKDEESKNLQSTSFFRDMLSMRIQAFREEKDEESKANDEAIKQQNKAADAAAEEKARHSTAMDKIQSPGKSDFDAVRDQLNQEYNAKHDALQRDYDATQTMGQQKVAEQARINSEIEQLDKKHQDQMNENAAAQAQSQNAAAMETANAWGQSMLKVAEGHESMSKVATQAFDSMIAHSLQAALMEVAHEKTAQLAHAEAAAAAAFHAMAGIPVVGPVLGAAAAAATFAGAMAFNEGTDRVPGVGNGDTVDAKLTPGEGVVPGGIMDNLNKMAKDGGFNRTQPSTHVHMHNTYHVNTIDGDGMQDALDKHSDQIQRHVDKALRRQNR